MNADVTKKKEKIYVKLIQLFWITIVLSNILKLLGYKGFEIPIIDINVPLYLQIIINYVLFIINSLMFVTILIKRKLVLKEILLSALVMSPIFVLSFNYSLLVIKFILEIVLSCTLGIIFKKDKKYKLCIETIFIYMIIFIYQVLTSFYKNINLMSMPFLVEVVLQIDYYCLLTLTMLRELKKGDYIYEQWNSFILILSKQRRFKERLQQNQENVQEVENELGYKIFIVMLSITQLVIVGTACYFVNNAILEFVIVFVSFVFMRKVYGQSYHSNSVIRCTTLALLTFLISTRVSLPLWVSTLCNVFIGCLVAYIMHIMYYYIKYTKKGVTLRLGMNKDDLLKLCSEAGLSELNINRMVLRYVERKTIKEIADIEFVDDYTISQSLYRSRKKIREIQ